MLASNCQVRRATVDDLVLLRRMWRQAGLRFETLEKRLTDFQVIETAGGELLGGIGCQIEGQQGRIHSEVYSDAQGPDELRPRLWERVLTVARNHGLSRLWIEQSSSPFWLESGFEVAESESLEALPASFRSDAEKLWLTLKLREETSAVSALDQQMELFRQSGKEQHERLLRRAQGLKIVAALMTAVVLIVVTLGIWVLWHATKGSPAKTLTR